MTLRWKMDPKESGPRRIGAGPARHTLRDDGRPVLHVAPLGGGWRGPVAGWYWYGCGANTASVPVATVKDAKDAAMAFYKARMAADMGTLEKVVFSEDRKPGP